MIYVAACEIHGRGYPLLTSNGCLLQFAVILPVRASSIPAPGAGRGWGRAVDASACNADPFFGVGVGAGGRGDGRAQPMGFTRAGSIPAASPLALALLVLQASATLEPCQRCMFLHR